MFNLFNLPMSGCGRVPELEVIHRPGAKVGAGASRSRPLLFVHGAYAGAWCWDEHFLGYFSSLGYDCHALSLRGHGLSAGHWQLHRHGILDYVADVRQVVQALPVEPILIGHSMGAMVIQKYLESYHSPGVVLMAPVPPAGLSASMFQLMATDPLLLYQMSSMTGGGLTAGNVKYAGRAVFSDDLDSGLQQVYAGRMQQESQRALFDMTVANLPRIWRMNVPPMLVLAAEQDVLFPVPRVRRAARLFKARLVVLPDMAHAMMLEPQWPRAAGALADWLGDAARAAA